MRKVKIVAICSAICLVLAFSGGLLYALSASSDPMVTYIQSSDTFEVKNSGSIFAEAGDIVYENLFPEFTGLFPGDSRDQTIAVGADSSNSGAIKLYLKSAITNGAVIEGYDINQDLLRFLQLTVKDQSNGLTISQDLMENEILLGTFTPGSNAQLNINLKVAINMPNDLQAAAATLTWVFRAVAVGNSVTGTTAELERASHFSYIIGKPGGYISPESDITRAEAAAIFFRIITDESRAALWSRSNNYSDVAVSAWYNNVVSTMTNAGVIIGYEDGTFRPDNAITRAEFVTIMTRFYKLSNYSGDDYFSDISACWARDSINLAAEMQLISVSPDGTFRPDDTITRAEAVTIINHALGRHPDKDHLLSDMTVWPDNMDHSAWYYADLQEASNSHSYVNSVDYEIWLSIEPNRDWAAIEKG